MSLGMLATIDAALAYRPFDGTDAAVAKTDEIEIELQPAGMLREGNQTSLIAPQARINYGFMKDWEAVLEGLVETPLSPSGPSSLTATGAFLKALVRPGTLQDQSGISIATEFGVLLPEVNGDSRFGASVAGIFSNRWDAGAVHVNVAATLTREQRGDLFLGTIIEGPAKWTVRPVAEVFYEEEFGRMRTISGLVGLIWQVRDDLSFDLGLRRAFRDRDHITELRAGLTFGFPVGARSTAEGRNGGRK